MLPFLGLLLTLLGVLAAGGLAAPVRPFVPWAMAVLCAAGLVVVLASLLTGTEARLLLPVGPGLVLEGAGAQLRLDALSALFLAMLFAVGGAAALHGAGLASGRAAAEPSLPLAPVLLAADGLMLLAGDAPTFLIGLGTVFAAGWGAALARGGADARLPATGLACAGLFGTGCLAAAFGLLTGSVPATPAMSDGGLAPAAVFGTVPEGWRGNAVLLLTLLGAGSMAALAPLHAWLPPAQAALSGPAGTPSNPAGTLAGILLPASGLYVLARVLFGLGGAATPPWWGVPLLLMGIASALLGALRATMEDDLPRILAGCTTASTGLAAAALGVALVARGADLLPLATLAAGAAVLLTAAYGCNAAVLLLAADSIRHGAGSLRLDALGGLMRRMPVTACTLLAGAASTAGMPLLAGFAGHWTLLQALVVAPRVGGLAVPVLFAVAAAAAAASMALRAAAMVRLVGVAVLGRPRTPRAAVAEEVSLPARAAALGAAATCVAVGLLPGPLLLLSDRALDRLTRGDVPGQASWLRVAPAADASGYVPLALLALLAASLCAAWMLLKRYAGEARRAPAWEDGFDASAPWLPFGDPAAQLGARSAAQPFATAFGRAVLSAEERVEGAPLGRPAPARYRLRWRDPASALARMAADWMWVLTARLGARHTQRHALAEDGGATRRALAVLFAALLVALLLAALAGLGLTGLG